MPGTRSSARLQSSPSSDKTTSSGTKRKAEDSSPASASKAKRGRPSKASKEQKTLEETMPDAPEEAEDTEVKDADPAEEAKADADEATAEEGKVDQEPVDDEKAEAEEEAANGPEEKTTDDSKDESSEEPNAFDQTKESKTDDVNGNVSADAVQEDKKREQAQPSNILEKGIIYFFTRGRVGITEPESVQELQRSYFVMRPLPDGAKLTDGAIQDVGNNRLLALPKKVWPKSGKDRFMTFVEKASVSMDTLKEEFFQGSEYTTKTTGTRQTPPVTPVGEGVYALVSTQGSPSTSHLVYMLTIPHELDEVQKDVGLAEKGSFIISAKNPNSSGPSYAQLPKGAEYPKEILDEFGNRGWMPAKPEYLNYANAQMLLIGEDFDKSANLEPAPKDERDQSKETPQEELEKLEHEDELRVEHIGGDDTVFADLGISSKEYPSVKTTW